MKVEIITTGTELLLGEILNTNVQYLSRKLNNIGFDVLYQTTVGDNPERMRAVLEQAMQRADIIITSGGLGPTRGDITKEMVMEVCHTEGYLDLDTWGRIDAYFAKKGLCPSQNNEKQAYVPIGAEVLQNDVGTAPGLWLEYKDKIYIMLPGPPSELTDVCEKQLLPRMLQRFSITSCAIVLLVPRLRLAIIASITISGAKACTLSAASSTSTGTSSCSQTASASAREFISLAVSPST